MNAALFAIVMSSNVQAVCLDDHGVSGYHIPEAKEFRDAHAIVIGTVVAERSAPAPSRNEYAGTEYRLRIEETLKGPKYKEIALFSENSSGRFPMVKDEKYLVYVSAGRKYYYSQNQTCTTTRRQPCNSLAISSPCLYSRLD